MNKLASIKLAIEKQALLRNATEFSQAGFKKIRFGAKPPVVQTGAAAASAQQQGSKLAIEKRAMFAAIGRGIGSLYRRASAASNRVGQGIVSGASKAKSYIKPPVATAGGAAANAQQQGKVMGLLGGKLGVAGLVASTLPKPGNTLNHSV